MSNAKSKEKNVAYGARDKMPGWYPAVFSGRGISYAINFCFIAYLTYYCTDMLGLNAGIVGIMLVASKAIDAVTDLIAGVIVDKTKTRIGKARPYEIFIIFMWIFTVVLYSAPEMSKNAQYVFVFIMYVLINAVCATMLGASDSVYMARCFTTDKNRLKAVSVVGVIVMIASIAFSIVFPQLLNTIGSTREGWSKMAVWFAIPMIAVGILRFIFCKEVPIDKAEEGNSEKKKTKTLFAVLFKNKYIWIFAAMDILGGILANMSAATTYYFKYIQGDIGKMSLVTMTALATPVLIALFPAMTKKIGSSKVLQVLGIVGISGFIIRILGGTNMTTLVLGSLLTSVACMPVTTLSNAYIMECMDYGEKKTGVRVEGLMASVVNFSAKVGSALASGLVGFVMGMTDYNGTLTVQSQNANNAIILLFNYIPMVLMIIYTVLSFRYRADKEKQALGQE